MKGNLFCEMCGSENVSTERRIDGKKTCLDCGNITVNVSQIGHVVTDMYEDRAYKHCLCCACGKVSKCTPSNDFYTTPNHGTGIICERCFSEYIGHKLTKEKSTL